MTDADRIRVFLLDDHEVVRAGVRAMLDAEEDLDVIGEAGSAEDALRRIRQDPPDVAVVDVNLPDGSGVEVCREIRASLPPVAVLILTAFADDEALFNSILAGAAGYVLKQIRGNDLARAVRDVAAGKSLIDPSVHDRVLRRLRGETGDEEARLLGSLTEQERRILEKIAEGKTNRQIAGEVFLAEKTVKNYVSTILSKLGMSRRTEAVAFAVRRQQRHQQPPGTPPKQWP